MLRKLSRWFKVEGWRRLPALSQERSRLVLALLVFLILWLDGKFYPLILLPLLFVKLYDKKSLSYIGLGGGGLNLSLGLGAGTGLLVPAICYPVFIHYLGVRQAPASWTIALLTDLVWYPLYEEISYRGFFLGIFARRDRAFSGLNLALNLVQAILFVSVHHHHVSAGLPLLIIPVFLLGFLNGLVFLRSWNIAGCVLGHSLVNGLGLLILILATG